MSSLVSTSSSSKTTVNTALSCKSVPWRRSAKPRPKKTPVIPWAAHWGWGHLPISAKILLLGVFCGTVSLTTPFWAYIQTDIADYATYGLWHFCRGEHCTSIHDNILDGKSVPVWYHMVQGNMCIGVACSIIGLAILTNSIEGTRLKMTVTVHRACACILGISAAEHFMALYVFVSYLEETDFLFDRLKSSYELDFHGSFYAGVISFACVIVAALVVYTDTDISRVPKSVQPSYAFDNYCFTNDMYDYYGEADPDYLLYQNGYDNYGGWYVNDSNSNLDDTTDDSRYNDFPYESLLSEHDSA